MNGLSKEVPGSQWAMQHAGVAGISASISKPAVGNTRTVITHLTVSAVTLAAAPVFTDCQLVVYDSDYANVLFAMQFVIPAVAGQNILLSIPNLNIQTLPGKGVIITHAGTIPTNAKVALSAQGYQSR